METLNELTHLKVVERTDGTFDVVKGTFDNVLGNITFHSKDVEYCLFEAQSMLYYSDMEAISKIMLVINTRFKDFVTH